MRLMHVSLKSGPRCPLIAAGTPGRTRRNGTRAALVAAGRSCSTWRPPISPRLRNRRRSQRATAYRYFPHPRGAPDRGHRTRPDRGARREPFGWPSLAHQPRDAASMAGPSSPAPGATGDMLYGHRYLHEVMRAPCPTIPGGSPSRCSGTPSAADRQQRVVRHHPDAELGVRRVRRRSRRSLPGRPAGRDRPGQRGSTGPSTTASTGRASRRPRTPTRRPSTAFRHARRARRRLARERYLAGDRVTEADWRLFTTLVRFDAVYHGHFKCNLRRLVDYPHLWAYARELYQWPGVAETVDFAHIKRHYYVTHGTINPTGIVPSRPAARLRPTPRPRGAAGGRLGSSGSCSARRLRAPE